MGLSWRVPISASDRELDVIEDGFQCELPSGEFSLLYFLCRFCSGWSQTMRIFAKRQQKLWRCFSSLASESPACKLASPAITRVCPHLRSREPVSTEFR